MHDKCAITNICGGAVPDVFAKLLTEAMENAQDPNTKASQPRELNLKFKILPFADRSGAEITFMGSSKLASIQETKGNIYVTRRSNGELTIYPRDPRQDVLWTEEGSKA